ncbi:NAD(P)-binding protein [Laetiporus sulphureus 93-53]|uniref:NAD(P)-binding protein n=1 Tax=Laetiporus sulphureus 93-53 TaxID=1314785 RepID=A0A165GDZ6_9APHY|nr:NAD(P)-binding protein [Laetiporus sulphureus 93-53]KZT10215.1 NAD(P)-binding protein [Laetiporus sulphureus 93-53]
MTVLPSFRRIALVTGASRGIGRSIALRLADDGLDVAVNDRASQRLQLNHVVSEIEAKGGRALAVCADVTSENEVQELIGRTAQEMGGLDVMVANAGIIIARSLLDTPAEEWDNVMAVNLRGVMLSYKYAAKQMIKQGRGGRIIGASSLAGKRGNTNLSAYAATKFGVRGLTQALTRTTALELAQHNITVNTYAPGLIATPMSKYSLLFQHPDDGDQPARLFKELVNAPGMVVSGPEVVASLVSYLAKPESSFITEFDNATELQIHSFDFSKSRAL